MTYPSRAGPRWVGSTQRRSRSRPVAAGHTATHGGAAGTPSADVSRWIQEQIGGKVHSTVLSTGRQLAIVALVCAATILLGQDDPYRGVLVRLLDRNAVVQFFSALAQALAALLGLLIAFLLFTMQRIDEKVDSARRALTDDIQALLHRAGQLSGDLEQLTEPFDRIIDHLIQMRVEQLTDQPDRASLDAALTDLDNRVQALTGQLPRPAERCLKEILLTLQNVEESLRTLFIQRIAVMVTGLMIDTVVKLSILLGVALALILGFGAFDFQSMQLPSKLPVLAVAVTAGFLMMVLLILAELVMHTRLLYLDLQNR